MKGEKVSNQKVAVDFGNGVGGGQVGRQCSGVSGRRGSISKARASPWLLLHPGRSQVKGVLGAV